MHHRRPSRRGFLKHSTVIAAAGISAPFLVPGLTARAQVAPSERLTVGIIGTGVMGTGHVHRFAGDPAFQVLAVCDVDASRRERARRDVEAIYGQQTPGGKYAGCAAHNDYREVLARRDIDAVCIATPDHWHALLSIEAARAGKDVYCEKPISMTIQEGREVVRAMARYGRVFQTGTQYRSIPTVRRVVEFVRRGGLGKVKQAFALLNPIGGWLRGPRFRPYLRVEDADQYGKSYVPVDIGLRGEPVPPGLDWELWVGPAPFKPYNPAYHINPSPGVVPWAFCDAFGLTSNTWHLSHSADVIQYALGQETGGPVEIIHPASGQFPSLTCRYAGGTLLHFVDHWGMVKSQYKAVPADARLQGNFGGLFIGERGWITSMSTGGPIECGPPELFEELGLPSREVHIGANDHHANFLDCVRNRKKPSAHEEIGHRGASLGHLAYISYALGRSLTWNLAKEEFLNDDAANRLRYRAMRQPWSM